MTQKAELYAYLKSRFQAEEPIFLAELKVPDMPDENVRNQMRKLATDGLLCRFDNGIYFLPRESPSRFGPVLSLESVIRKKYLTDADVPCGYYSGLTFANLIGVTTQVPMVYEICTNKTTSDRQMIHLAGRRVILSMPRVPVDGDNVLELQFLDLLTDITVISELEGKALTDRLKKYMRSCGLGFDRLERYLPYYPNRIYKNMYEAGLLKGVVIQKGTR